MLYKFGLEFFNGSITTLATDRFKKANTFTKRKSSNLVAAYTLIFPLPVGAAQGVNQAAQCVGAILIAPLIRRWPTRTVLSAAIFVFALMTAILLIVDAATGQCYVFEERKHELINFIQMERSSLPTSKIRYMAIGPQTLCV